MSQSLVESGGSPRSTYVHCINCLGSRTSYGDSTNAELQTSQSSTLEVLICLNSDSFTNSLLTTLWNSCSVHILADGAANRLRSFFQNSKDEVGTRSGLACESYIPEFITGDLDSITKETADYYRERGTSIIHSSCQDTNDFEKSIDLALQLFDKSDKADLHIIVCGAFGGRLDQELSHYHACYRALLCFKDGKYLNSGARLINEDGSRGTASAIESKERKQLSISLLSETSVAIVLWGDCNHEIHVPPLVSTSDKGSASILSSRDVNVTATESSSNVALNNASHEYAHHTESQKVSCGLIPLFGEASLVTKGLLWNLGPESESLKMGRFISSSNGVLPPSRRSSHEIDHQKSHSLCNCRCMNQDELTSVVDVSIANPDEAVLWTCELNLPGNP